MKKILVLSYFFPPCTQTASNRVLGIVSHLKGLGYHPIVVTREWDVPLSMPKDTLVSSGTNIRHVENELYEAYYLPYKSSFRDRIYIKSEKILFYKYFSKLLTFFMSFLELISYKFIPYSNLYTFSKQLIKNDSEINCVFISANPYMLFKFGYLLNKTTKISWIADYRDAWTTNSMSKKERNIYKLLYFFYRRFEKKWVSTSSFFTTVSEKYVHNIGQLISKPGFYIYNGLNDFSNKNQPDKQDRQFIRVLYAGTIYKNQDVESLLKNVYEMNQSLTLKIGLSFVGVSFNSAQQARIANSIYFTEHIKLYPWLSKSELNKMIEETDLLLMLSYKGYDGIPTSKLFEYLSYHKPIILYPTDNGLLAHILSEVGTHHILQSDKDLIEILTAYSNNYNEAFQKFSVYENNLDKYLTINQVKRLVTKINTII